MYSLFLEREDEHLVLLSLLAALFSVYGFLLPSSHQDKTYYSRFL